MHQLKRQTSINAHRRSTAFGSSSSPTNPAVRSRRLTERRTSTVIPALGASRTAEGGRVESTDGNDLHDALLNQYIAMGFQRVGSSTYVLQPFDTLRLNLDAVFTLVCLTNAILVPLQVAFGWPGYWGEVFSLACVLDGLAIVDCISYMFTGFMLPAQDDLFDEEKEREIDEREMAARRESERREFEETESTGGTDPMKRQRKKSFIRRTVSEVNTDDATLSKVVEDAGIPKLVLDYRMILQYYFYNHGAYDLLFLAGCCMDFMQVRGNVCVLLLLKLVALRKGLSVSLANLTTHSERFQNFLDNLATQAALLHYIIYLVFFCHWIGCLFLYFAWKETSSNGGADGGDGSGDDDDDGGGGSDDDGLTIGGHTLELLGKNTLSEQYTLALYWALQTIITVGYGDVSLQKDTVVMMIYSSFIILCSLLIGTLFTASTTVWLSNLKASEEKFQRKLHVLKEFLQTYRGSIPVNLQTKLYLYLDFNYRQNQSTNMMDELLDGLPTQLKTAVKLATTQELIRKVTLFQNVSKSFISAIVMYLRPSVVLKNDHIFRCGDHGEEMFFLNRGHLAVLLPIGKPEDEKKTQDGRRASPSSLFADDNPANWKKVASLRSGAYFGEISLFTADSTRTATVQAVINSTYFTLSRSDFNRICPSFPEVTDMIKNRAKAILKKNAPAGKGPVVGPTIGSSSSGAAAAAAPSAGAMAAAAAAAEAGGGRANGRAFSIMRVDALKNRALASTVSKTPGGIGRSSSNSRASVSASGPSPAAKTTNAAARLRKGSVFLADSSAAGLSSLSDGLGRMELDEEDDPAKGGANAITEEDIEKAKTMEIRGQLPLILACREVLVRWNGATKAEVTEECDEQKIDTDGLVLACRVAVDPNQAMRDNEVPLKEICEGADAPADMVAMASKYDGLDCEDLFLFIKEEAGNTISDARNDDVPVSLVYACRALLKMIPGEDDEDEDTD